MKSVGLITMHRVANHGSVLQALATQKAIRQLGCNCLIIDYAYPTDDHLKRMGIDWYPHERNIWQLIKKVIRRRPSRQIYQRLECFYWFRKRFLQTTKKTYYSNEELRMDALAMPFDIYCVGSDQVWNPKYTMDDGVFLLDFVPNCKKKISYSSSFTVNQLENKYQKDFYGSHLKMFDSLSVREQSGIEIIRDLTGKEATCVLDPVFLLTKEQWVSTLKIKEKKKPYVFFYSLNYMADTMQKMIQCLDRIINSENSFMYVVSNKEISSEYDVEVINDDNTRKFVEYIANASLVLTDSFHASAFALIFEVPVYGFSANKNDDRISSLFKLLGIQDCCINTRENYQLTPLMFFCNITDRILKLRKESIQYLQKAIE